MISIIGYIKRDTNVICNAFIVGLECISHLTLFRKKWQTTNANAVLCESFKSFVQLIKPLIYHLRSVIFFYYPLNHVSHDKWAENSDETGELFLYIDINIRTHYNRILSCKPEPDNNSSVQSKNRSLTS